MMRYTKMYTHTHININKNIKINTFFIEGYDTKKIYKHERVSHLKNTF